MTSPPLLLLGVGFVLGLRHAMEADHVVAVAAITSRTRRMLSAAWLGVVWGLGHSLTLFIAGATIIVLGLSVPPRLALGLELCVALTLIVVGLLNLGSGGPRAADSAAEGRDMRLPAGRAFGVGLVHGLAGSTASALLVLASVSDPAWACAYLAVLGLGTLIGMALVAMAIVSPLRLFERRITGLGPTMRLASGVLSVVFGAWLGIRIGWVDGLFRG